MIIDARSLPENEIIETDVCIVGAGIAGITLARELAGQDFSVSLLESGGFEPDPQTQSLYWGENVGHPYYELDTARTRAFGGTSHRWEIELGEDSLGVRLRPLDKIDFEERDWVPYSGWPFDKAHLDPYYERAQSVLKIGPYTYAVEDWADLEKTPVLPFLTDRMKTTMFQFARRDVFIKDYRKEISQTENITTYLRANVVDIETNETTQTATRLRVASLEGNRFWVSAKIFVLATGAIEAPRLLLASNKSQTAGLGNGHDLVGRFFMEHPHHWLGTWLPSDPDIFNTTDLYNIHMMHEVPVMGKLMLSEEVLRREKLLSWCFSIHPRSIPRALRYPRITSKGIKSLKVLGSAIGRGKVPNHLRRHLSNVIASLDDFGAFAFQQARKAVDESLERFEPDKPTAFQLNQMAEQVPNPDSRVILSDERDVLGLRRANLDWQLSEIDIRSMVRSQEIADEEFRRTGLGTLHFHRHDDPPDSHIKGGWHHMGTTRMHVNPKQGVVDKNSRIHGMSNLFVAGPSVFPTGGYSNPVLTLVALSIRLGDHVKSVMTHTRGYEAVREVER